MGGMGEFRGMKSDYGGRAKQAIHVPAGRQARKLLRASVMARAFVNPLGRTYWTPKTGRWQQLRESTEKAEKRPALTSNENWGSSNSRLWIRGRASSQRLILRTNSPWLPAAFPHATRGDCQHREPTSAGNLSGCAVPSGRRWDREERRPRAPRLPSPSPTRARCSRPGCSRGAGSRARLTFFSAGTSNPRHLGAFSSLKNSYGSCCACMVPPGRLRAGRGAAAAAARGEPPSVLVSYFDIQGEEKRIPFSRPSNGGVFLTPFPWGGNSSSWSNLKEQWNPDYVSTKNKNLFFFLLGVGF